MCASDIVLLLYSFLVFKQIVEIGAKELMDDTEKTTSQTSRKKEGGIWKPSNTDEKQKKTGSNVTI